MEIVEYSKDFKVLIKARDVNGHFVVPEGVTEIWEGAFQFCDLLTSIEIPDSVTEIGGWTFAYCDILTKYTYA